MTKKDKAFNIIQDLRKKRKTFRQAVDLTLKAYKGSAKKLHAKHPGWLQSEIKIIESFIDENPRLEQKYVLGVDGIPANNLSFVDEELHQSTEECIQLFKDSDGGQKLSPWICIERSNPALAKMFIFKEYLPFLKELNGKPEESSNQEQTLSPLEKVQQVEKAKERDGITSYDKAIDLIESETGERPFKDYNSFKGVRYRWREYL